MYQDGKLGEVDPYQLDTLISLGKIRKFRRSGEWVTIGVDPMRQVKEDYLKVPKRQGFPKKTKKKE